MRTATAVLSRRGQDAQNEPERSPEHALMKEQLEELEQFAIDVILDRRRGTRRRTLGVGELAQQRALADRRKAHQRHTSRAVLAHVKAFAAAALAARLKQLRAQTREARDKQAQLKQKRKATLKARLKKVKQRKLIREGKDPALAEGTTRIPASRQNFKFLFSCRYF